ncbi:MAG: hypothetical protein N2654_07220, partial [Deltaproteobacteria bacterium]|nr:hypothetical protein [Deltaproteobacteria bacterium]
MAIRKYDPQRRFEGFDMLRQPKNMNRYEVLKKVVWGVMPEMVKVLKGIWSDKGRAGYSLE